MNKKTWISALAISVVMGSTLAIPAIASAHEVVREKSAKMIGKFERPGDVDHRYLEHHRKVGHHGPRSRHSHRYYGPGRGHKYGHHKQRHEHHVHRPARQHHDYRHHRNDGIRVHIDYDFWL